MNIAHIFTLLLITSCGTSTEGDSAVQQSNSAEKTLMSYDTVKVETEIFENDRQLLVWLPPDYSDSTKYPVLYVSSYAEREFHYISGAVQIMSSLRVIPELIVVGINEIDGTRDLTPTQTDNYGPTSGGADDFLRHLEEEVVPLMEKRYSVSSRRIYVGHSITGTLGSYSLLVKPELFSDYILISPWLTYDKPATFLIDKAKEISGIESEREMNVYFTIGDEPNLDGLLAVFVELIKSKSGETVATKLERKIDDDHMSIMPGGVIEGLKWIFRE